MKPPEGFSAKVRARVIELTGDDPGAFKIGSFTPGPRWTELTEAEQIDILAQSIARRDEWTGAPSQSSQPQVDVAELVKNL